MFELHLDRGDGEALIDRDGRNRRGVGRDGGRLGGREGVRRGRQRGGGAVGDQDAAEAAVDAGGQRERVCPRRVLRGEIDLKLMTVGAGRQLRGGQRHGLAGRACKVDVCGRECGRVDELVERDDDAVEGVGVGAAEDGADDVRRRGGRRDARRRSAPRSRRPRRR